MLFDVSPQVYSVDQPNHHEYVLKRSMVSPALSVFVPPQSLPHCDGIVDQDLANDAEPSVGQRQGGLHEVQEDN